MVIYLDSGSPSVIEKYIDNVRIDGVTTNPTLVKAAGIKDYRSYAKTILGIIGTKEVSFEVLADTEEGMLAQAQEIASWGKNIYVKIPITYTDGSTTEPLMEKLDELGVRMNVTAVMSNAQIMDAILTLKNKPHIISVFAGRIADTGRCPSSSFVWYAKRKAKSFHRILWASAREVYNYYEACRYCDIITLSPALFDKLTLEGKNLKAYSLETVRQFYEDGKGLAF